MRTEYEVRQEGAGTTAAELIKDDIARIFISVVFESSSSGKVQYTLSTNERVEAGTAKWYDWTSGVVSSDTVQEMTAPNAIRLVNAGTGNVRLEVRGNY